MNVAILLLLSKAIALSPTTTLSTSLKDLSNAVGGSGRAKGIWEALRRGVEPLDEVSMKTRQHLASKGIQRFVPATAESAQRAADGTTKLLVRFNDGLAVETVLIPHWSLPRTTLCVSTQVGCDRGCRFCATGKMGLLRNLTASEIAAQYFCALPYAEDAEKPLSNVVFMGMGDAGINCDSAADAARILTDDFKFKLAKHKLTVSTVGPNPFVFQTLADAPCQIAWSLHTPHDDLRRNLVPSSQRYTTVELRDGLITALKSRSAVRTRTLMIAVTLIAGINDSDDDAQDLVEFVGPLIDDAAVKLNLDLIPVNPIDGEAFQRPSDDRIRAFVTLLRHLEPRIHVAVRLTRGDDQNAACGQLLLQHQRRRSRVLL